MPPTRVRTHKMVYTIDEIRDARAVIKETIIEKQLYNKGKENFISLNGDDVAALFNLYDQVFFQGQIKDKIIETSSDIQFFARARKTGVAGLCGVKKIEGRRVYYLDIAPNVVEALFKYHKGDMPFAAGVGCNDRLGCVQLIMEHEIIHLITIIWGFSSADPDDKVYGFHGTLFVCMIKKYFGHNRFDHDLGLTGLSGLSGPFGSYTPTGIPAGFLRYQSSRTLIGAGYQNWSASCYLDSILMVLFDSISPFWRKNIMDVDVSAINYTGKIFGAARVDEAPRQGIRGDTLITSTSKMRDVARKIQAQMKEDYATTHAGKKVIKCTMLRQLLAEVAPSMKQRGQWVLFNTGAVYDAIVNVFPELSMDIPYQIHRWVVSEDGQGRYDPDSVDYASEASITMWDYLDPLTDVGSEQDYKEIRWDLVDNPVLVFYNGGAPRVRNFGRSGRERGYVYIQGDRTHKMMRHEFDIIKARSFGMTIIDDRYRLVGVITLEGVSPVNEGGSHYTAHFLGTDEHWYYYNDIGARVMRVESLPEEGVWVEGGSSMPSMYFYQRMRRPFPVNPSKKSPKTTPKTRTPVVPNTKAEPFWYQGTALNYKKMRSGSDPYDEAYMYFVYDKTKDQQLSPVLNTLMPFTNVDTGIRMWKINGVDQVSFEEKIKEIDVAWIKRLSQATGIDTVALGDVYREYPNGLKIVNYTENTFAVVSASPLDGMEDGMHLRNLKYDLKGFGYIYPKKYLKEVEDRLT